MSQTSIIDLPPEIFQDFIFAHLSDDDIYSLGRSGNARLKAIAEDYINSGELTWHTNIYSSLYYLYSIAVFDILIINTFFFRSSNR